MTGLYLLAGALLFAPGDLSIGFVGDVMLGHRYRPVLARSGNDFPFAATAPLLASFDLLVGNLERSADLLENCATELVMKGLDGIVLRAGSLLPEDLLSSHPHLLLAYAWALTLRQQQYDKALDVMLTYKGLTASWLIQDKQASRHDKARTSTAAGPYHRH